MEQGVARVGRRRVAMWLLVAFILGVVGSDFTPVRADVAGDGGEVAESGATLPNHVVINQVYGKGDADDGAVSHSFIELYNPTDESVDLNGYSVQYAPGVAAWEKLDLTGKSIGAKCSFLIRCTSEVVNEGHRYEVGDADMEWEIPISNRAFEVALVGDQELLGTDDALSTAVVDLVGVANSDTDVVDHCEGVHFMGISKQKSARRKNFADTDNNADDFESIDYRAGVFNDEEIEKLRPRSSGEGAWGVPTGVEQPIITKQLYVVMAEQGEEVTIDVEAVTENGTGTLRYQWFRIIADGGDADELDGGVASSAPFLSPDSIIDGANQASYTVPTEDVGTNYYCCEVTNGEGEDAVSAMSVATKVEVVEELPESPSDDVIINQIYGVGSDPAISHGFIELYNPTDEDVSLEGYSVQYAKGREEGQGPDKPGSWAVLDLSEYSIEAKHSFLIRCNPGSVKAGFVPRYVIADEEFDVSWDQDISNRAIQVALVHDTDALSPQIVGEEFAKVVDLIGVLNAGDEGDKVYHFEGLESPEFISKQKTARRTSFVDTNNNAGDWESVDYRSDRGMTDAKLEMVRPYYSGDGAWGAERGVQPTTPPTSPPTSVEPTGTPPATVLPTRTPPASAEPSGTPPPTVLPTRTPPPTVLPTRTPPASAEPTSTPSASAAPSPSSSPSIAPSESPSTNTAKVPTVGKVKAPKLASKKARTLTVTIKPVSGAKGYEVVYAQNNKLTKKKKKVTTKKTTVTIKKLRARTKYYVKVRAYKLDAKGKKVFGKYSTVKGKKVKA